MITNVGSSNLSEVICMRSQKEHSNHTEPLKKHFRSEVQRAALQVDQNGSSIGNLQFKENPHPFKIQGPQSLQDVYRFLIHSCVVGNKLLFQSQGLFILHKHEKAPISKLVSPWIRRKQPRFLHHCISREAYNREFHSFAVTKVVTVNYRIISTLHVDRLSKKPLKISTRTLQKLSSLRWGSYRPHYYSREPPLQVAYPTHNCLSTEKNKRQ